MKLPDTEERRSSDDEEAFKWCREQKDEHYQLHWAVEEEHEHWGVEEKYELFGEVWKRSTYVIMRIYYAIIKSDFHGTRNREARMQGCVIILTAHVHSTYTFIWL